MRGRGLDFGEFEITFREILVSISIIAVMLLFGFVISGKISQSNIDKNEKYNKAIKIENDKDMFQYGMETNVGNAFVYGKLKAVDTVTFPEIGGEYMYVEKVEERYERHEETVTKEDDDGNEYEETEVYYTWDEYDSESLHSKEIKFCGIKFPYEKICLPSSSYVKTIPGSRVYSFESGEYVKVRFEYYGVKTKFNVTIFTTLKDNTISDNTQFYENRNIKDAVDALESNGNVEQVLFWIFWIVITGALVFGFYYLDNEWLE